ncbi:MAG: Uncharacterised protein [Gammaproteobacteria bacterium]|nr:MAG: Uncharacterised protein [Gammaproteobacteria bacterium]
MRERGINQVTTGCMLKTLWLTCRTRRIQDKQRIFCIHWFWFAFRGLTSTHVVVPNVPRAHINISARAFHDNDFINPFTRVHCERFINVRFQRNLATTAAPLVRSNDDRRPRLFNANSQGVWRKPPKYNRVHGTNAGTSQHRDSRLGDHGHVQSNHVAFLNALRPKTVGKTTDAFIEITIRDFFIRIWVVALPNNRCLIPASRQVAVKTVRRDV